jgi:hypothetical protein
MSIPFCDGKHEFGLIENTANTLNININSFFKNPVDDKRKI